MPSKYELCPQCGAILKTAICMKCGYDHAAIAELSDPDIVLEENESLDVKPIPEKIEAHEQVRSIFTDIAVASGVADTSVAVKVVRNKFIAPLILSFIFLLAAGASYWRFVYFTPEYVSPMVLSAADIKAINGAVETTGSMTENENEKTIDLATGLESGNFAAENFAQFGAQNTKVLVQAFNIKTIFEKFRNETILKELQEGYDVSDDDLGVYFSKGVAYFVPGDNLDTWGFAIGVNDKDYVETRLEAFKKNKENPKYKYVNYSARLVTITPEGKAVVEEATTSVEEDDKKKVEDEKKEEESDSDIEEETTGEQYYLLISNSNEYLDQMRESSEGNLTNLANEIIYAQSKVDLPQLGEVLVYKDKDASVWPMLVDIAASKFDYVGLDKIIKTIQSTGAAFYSVDSKLRISMSEN